jgi:hypothetical protein
MHVGLSWRGPQVGPVHQCITSFRSTFEMSHWTIKERHPGRKEVTHATLALWTRSSSRAEIWYFIFQSHKNTSFTWCRVFSHQMVWIWIILSHVLIWNFLISQRKDWEQSSKREVLLIPYFSVGKGCIIAAPHRFLAHVVDSPMAGGSYACAVAQHIGANGFLIRSECIEVVDTMKAGGFWTTSATVIYDECCTLWTGFY